MKYSFNLLTIFYCLIVIACNKPTVELIDTAALSLTFRATFANEPLILDQQKEYDYEGKSVRFSKVNFYLANLVAVNDDGETELSEIQFIDLTSTHNTTTTAEKGTTKSFSRVPTGAYNYLQVGVGVPSDLNKTNPSDYGTNHPLGSSNNNEYREDWKGYVFVRLEGQYDKDGDGFASNDIDFAYEIGGRANLYKTIDLDNSLNLSAGETTTLDFELDVRRLLTRPAGSLIPIIDYDPNDQNEERQIIMNNFEKALQLK